MFNFKHPRDIHLGYLSHLKFAWLESIRAFTMSIVMLIHGIFPFILDKTFSNYIDKASYRIKTVGS
jgi:hypothetical protein